MPTATRNNFAAALNPRDDCCVFTDIDASLVAAHIIPFNKQKESSQPPAVVYSLSSFELLQVLAGNRSIDPYNPNDGVGPTDINDILEWYDNYIEYR